MKFVEKEKSKLEKGQIKLRRRRLNWSTSVKQRVLDLCTDFAVKANSQGYPYKLSCYLGSKNKNAETIQFNIGMNRTGIEKNEIEHNEDSIINKKTYISEKGSALVFSQGPSGRIMVLLYPYKSEVHRRKEKYVILFSNLEPDDLTKKLVLSALYKSLFYARLSSLNGIANGFSLLDRALLFKMHFLDVRSRIKRRKAVSNLNNEWWKITITAIVTLFITLLAQNFSPMT